MRILIQSRGVAVTQPLRGHVEGQIGLALGRFADRIARVTVRFSRADAESRCQAEVSLHPPKVRAEDTDADLFAMVDRLADRLSRSMTRALELKDVPTGTTAALPARRRTTAIRERK